MLKAIHHTVELMSRGATQADVRLRAKCQSSVVGVDKWSNGYVLMVPLILEAAVQKDSHKRSHTVTL